MRFNWKNVALFLLTLAVLILCMLMLRTFLAAIVWAVVLAVSTQRPFRWLRAKLGNATGSATIAVSAVAICVVLPSLSLVGVIGQYAVTIGKMLRNGSFERSVQAAVDHHPLLASLVQEGSGFLAWSKAAERAGAFLATHAVALLSNSAAAIAQIVIMLFLLFFLYRDGGTALRALYLFLPMEEREARRVVTGVQNTILATFLGHFVVAAIQGVVAGTIFAVLGVHGAAVLGVLTALAALVPYFGAYVVWLPVAFYLGLNGHWIKAIIKVAAGTLVISTLDNLLYPMLVGAQLRQHTAMIFLSLLGGIWLFGISGIVLGPVLFSMAESLLGIWRERNGPARGEPAQAGPPG